jgi:SAM-dependent methyltransferase
MRHISCPVCDLKDTTPVLQSDAGALGVLTLVRCRNCGVAYLDPQPDPADMAPFYAPDYYGGAEAKFGTWVEGMRNLAGSLRARRLAAGLAPGARVLDVGCGDGRLLAAFAALGYACTGTERAQDHPRPGSAAAGVEIHTGDLAEVGLAENCFDLCVFWHVLEHLHDPYESLVEARQILSPGGRLVVAVPNFESLQAVWSGGEWFHLDLPRHLFHFTPRSLAALLCRAGFRVHRLVHHCLEQNPYGILQSTLNRWKARGSEPNLLYEILKGTRPDVPLGRRVWLRTLFLLGMPIALCLATLESIIGRGGTIEAWATSPESVLSPIEVPSKEQRTRPSRTSASEPALARSAAPSLPLIETSR